ncbi:hypothetical protein NZD89_25145 [Alicyclobacillus fastidiosus]|uniref:Uncharacterized protein n=1 Tax=Alicyclobacillus fastidiosus TaxID=392011 RepID=A0ABY6ZHA1_9BACL|nr:hypothetical protein [Alicyclobacillus fastidiosus]WAH41489.1 hypothetical protein NZD89_25145 [Alicyclobacillus fastidiosus]
MPLIICKEASSPISQNPKRRSPSSMMMRGGLFRTADGHGTSLALRQTEGAPSAAA